ALHRVAEGIQFGGCVTTSAWRVWSRDERQRRGRHFLFRKGEVVAQRDRVHNSAVNLSQNWIERIAWREVLDRLAGFNEASHRQRQQFVGTVADDDIFGVAFMESGQFFAERLGTWIRIEPQAAVYR